MRLQLKYCATQHCPKTNSFSKDSKKKLNWWGENRTKIVKLTWKFEHFSKKKIIKKNRFSWIFCFLNFNSFCISEITHPNVCLFLGACFGKEVMLGKVCFLKKNHFSKKKLKKKSMFLFYFQSKTFFRNSDWIIRRRFDSCEWRDYFKYCFVFISSVWRVGKFFFYFFFLKKNIF